MKRTRHPAVYHKTATATYPTLIFQAPAGPAPQSVLPRYVPTRWTGTLLFLFMALSIGCRAAHRADAAFIFLVCAILLVFSRILHPRHFAQVLLFIALGWFLTASALGAFHNFQYAFLPFCHFSLSKPILYFAIGFGLLAAFWRYLPPADATLDISRFQARIWFWVIFATAAFLRMYDPHHAVGQYWDDPALCVVDPRQIMEYHWFPILMPFASREPFYSYFLAGLWALMPEAHAIFIQRLGSALIDLTAVWLLYLLGKEVGGRVTGLVAAALGALSKPMIIQTLLGMTGVTTPMAVTLILLMSVRLFKKPGWSRFIQWGLALGFAPYNYTPIRPWLLFLVIVVFLWIWFYREKGRVGKWEARLGAGTLVLWCYLFFLKNNFVPPQNPLVVFLNHPWAGIAAAALLWFFFLRSRNEDAGRADAPPSLLRRWFLGLFLAALVMAPLASQSDTAGRLSYVSIFHDSSTATFHFQFKIFAVLAGKIWLTLQTLFLQGMDRDDMCVHQLDAFFEYHFLPLFALGLAAFLAQPSWMRLFLVAGGFVGLSAHILSSDPHSAKMTGSLAPLAVLSGLAVQQVCSAWKKTTSRRPWAVFIPGAVLAAYFAWAAWASFDRIWVNYAKQERCDMAVSRQVEKYASENRVYMASFPYWASVQVQTLLNQGRELFLLQEKNPIYLRKGEKTRDVAVLMAFDDKRVRSAIDRQFKNVKWESVSQGGGAPGAQPVARRALISASEIPEGPGKLFYFQRVPDSHWIRDYYAGTYIFGDGVIEFEECVPTPYCAIPTELHSRFMRLKGSFRLPADGPARFQTVTGNFVELKVDGKRVMKVNPGKVSRSLSGTADLAAGDHDVEYFNYTQWEQAVPKISIVAGGLREQTLGVSDRSPAKTRRVVSVFKY